MVSLNVTDMLKDRLQAQENVNVQLQLYVSCFIQTVKEFDLFLRFVTVLYTIKFRCVVWLYSAKNKQLVLVFNIFICKDAKDFHNVQISKSIAYSRYKMRCKFKIYIYICLKLFWWWINCLSQFSSKSFKHQMVPCCQVLKFAAFLDLTFQKKVIF